ncbi:Fe2+ or Zn2+ uptake regulation protein [Anaerobranca californiensis DSM 14826]|jgi:Fe2+ or Zn2+ uptake regulation protein|uniref:Fe2+ or Zn2+ uptake regulation protein n=1 Tax=Anaerobranca californiensis DSM 14826 TaxID=1120989 RepID=A0A1M6MWR0_9FIRM|nr:transcriptional repressor [Anaerobranca californiensis]SHJ87864.1 Fe2+ or Zn2+ uptake regulation protein [Anaerobranca californiensis DSM 14826]
MDKREIFTEISLFKRILEEKGLKFSKQRKLILEQFFIEEKHLNVEEIYQRLKKYNIGLATVYRNVKIFNNIGLLKEIVVDEVSYYELKIYSKKPLHIHFKCISCNDIIDVDERKIVLEYLKLNKDMEDRNGFEIYDVNIMFYGYCQKCKGCK